MLFEGTVISEVGTEQIKDAIKKFMDNHFMEEQNDPELNGELDTFLFDLIIKIFKIDGIVYKHGWLVIKNPKAIKSIELIWEANSDFAMKTKSSKPQPADGLSVLPPRNKNSIVFANSDMSFSPTSDKSSLSSTGGIDFNADKMNLQTQNAGQAIKFNVSAGGGSAFGGDPAMLKQLQDSPGFTPVIINIQPMTDLRLFLGLGATSLETVGNSLGVG